jgi:hypothetical protein
VALTVKSTETKMPVFQAEDTPAYKILQSFNLLDASYRKEHFEDIFESHDLTPNSSSSQNIQKKFRWGVYWTPGCGLIIYVSVTM